MKAIWQNCTFFIGPFEGVGTLYGQHLLEHQFKAALVLCLDRMEEEVVVLHISSRALEKISIGQRHFHPQHDYIAHAEEGQSVFLSPVCESD